MHFAWSGYGDYGYEGHRSPSSGYPRRVLASPPHQQHRDRKTTASPRHSTAAAQCQHSAGSGSGQSACASSASVTSPAAVVRARQLAPLANIPSQSLTSLETSQQRVAQQRQCLTSPDALGASRSCHDLCDVTTNKQQQQQHQEKGGKTKRRFKFFTRKKVAC